MRGQKDLKTMKKGVNKFENQKLRRLYELQRVMLHQPGRPMIVFSKKLNSFSGEAA